MKHKPTTVRKEAERIAMTAKERHLLRARIVAYMEYHPLRVSARSSRLSFFSAYAYRFFSWRTIQSRIAAGAALLFLCAGVPAAAERALPGDVLYPVKVRFNEEVRSQLLLSPYEKMQWEAKRVERRIAEARLLVQEGRLDGEMASALEETMRAHATAFQEQLAELREDDAGSAAVAEVTLESALDVQSAVLDTEIKNAIAGGGSGENVTDLAAIVREARDDVASSTDAVSDDISYEPLAGRVEENTTRISVLVEDLRDQLSETEKNDIKERMREVNGRIVDARTAREKRRNDEAVRLLREALAATEKIIAFIGSVDIRAHVALETLVPSASATTSSDTPEMQLESLASRYEAVVGAADVSGGHENGLSEKLAELKQMLDDIRDHLSAGRTEEALRMLEEAAWRMTDLEAGVEAGESIPSGVPQVQ